MVSADRRATITTVGVLLFAVAVAGARGAARQNTQAAPAGVGADGALSAAAQNALVQQYCVTCHNDAKNTAGLSLQHFDVAAADPDILSSMVDMLKAGAMPPSGQPRPEAGTLFALTNALASRVAPGDAPAPSHDAARNANASAERQPETTVITFPHQADRMAPDAQTAILHTVCAQCHNDDRKTGGVSFERATIEEVANDSDLAERAIAKLRAGMMPPPTAPKRPDPASLGAFVVSLERRVDEAAALHPNPGGRVAQRLNRR